jgi:hypothetical protein
VTAERARRIILRYGWNATAYQLLKHGFEHWYPAAGDALVGYVTAGRTAARDERRRAWASVTAART